MKHGFTFFIYGTLIITLCLLSSILCLPVSASVPEPGSTVMVYSQTELMNWFDTHPNGGEIALGNNIDAGKYLTLNAISPVTIHMNGYGFKIPQHGYMSISGEVTMISIDNPQPVIESATATNISFSKGVKIKVVNGCGISFMGSADSELVSGDSSCLISSFFNISVSGRESIGIKSNGNISLNSFNITLSKGACGIKASGNVTLFLAGITGNGKPIQSQGAITLDCCGMTVVPSNASVINRTVTLNDLYPNYIISPGSKESLLYRLPFALQFTFQSDDPAVPDRLSLLPVTWNVENIDTETPGIYELTTYKEDFPILGLDYYFPQINGTVLVTSPGSYYLYSAASIGKNVRIYFYMPPAKESIIELYFSTDAGSSWKPFEGYTYLYPGELYLETYLDKNLSYLFQADITIDGITTRTNILKIEYKQDGTITPQITDGDRDGSDRDDQPVIPPGGGIAPPGETSPPDDSLLPPSPDDSDSTEKPGTNPPDTETEYPPEELPDGTPPSVKPPASGSTSGLPPASGSTSGLPPASGSTSALPPASGSTSDPPPASGSTSDLPPDSDSLSGLPPAFESSYGSSQDSALDSASEALDQNSHQTDQNQVMTPPDKVPNSSDKTESEKQGSFMQETSPVLKANASAGTDQGESSITDPMPVGKAGKVLPKLLLLCSAVILACLTLYWRDRRKS